MCAFYTLNVTLKGIIKELLHENTWHCNTCTTLTDTRMHVSIRKLHFNKSHITLVNVYYLCNDKRLAENNFPVKYIRISSWEHSHYLTSSRAKTWIKYFSVSFFFFAWLSTEVRTIVLKLKYGILTKDLFHTKFYSYSVAVACFCAGVLSYLMLHSSRVFPASIKRFTFRV